MKKLHGEALLINATDLFKSGMSIEDIEKKLIPSVIDEENIAELKKLLKKLNHERKRKRGANTIVAGISLLGIGFLLTVFFFHQGTSINYAMYGFTIAGILIVFVGLIDIFG